MPKFDLEYFNACNMKHVLKTYFYRSNYIDKIEREKKNPIKSRKKSSKKSCKT